LDGLAASQQEPGKPVLHHATAVSNGDWLEKGNCTDPNISADTMYPVTDEGVDAAKAICSGCVVVEECQEKALSIRLQDGVMGGKSEQERRKILRQRAKNRL